MTSTREYTASAHFELTGTEVTLSTGLVMRDVTRNLLLVSCLLRKGARVNLTDLQPHEGMKRHRWNLTNARGLPPPVVNPIKVQGSHSSDTTLSLVNPLAVGKMRHSRPGHASIAHHAIRHTPLAHAKPPHFNGDGKCEVCTLTKSRRSEV